MNLTFASNPSSLTSCCRLFLYFSPSCFITSGWVCPIIKYNILGSFFTTCERARIAYSMPLPLLISPKVEATSRFFRPNAILACSVSANSMFGQPCGMTLMFLQFIPWFFSISIAEYEITMVEALASVIHFKTSKAFGLKSGRTVWRVVTTGFLRVSRKNFMYSPNSPPKSPNSCWRLTRSIFDELMYCAAWISFPYIRA